MSGGVLTPAFLPGLPLVLAAGTWLSGLGGALLMPAVLGGCAVLSFGGVVGRLAGGRWAPVGALVLAVSLPEIYVSRTPFSEPLVQVLLFGGLCMFIDSFGVVGGGLAVAGLGGLALGLTVLTWIGSLSILLPAFPMLAWLFVARRRQAAPFGIGLFVGIAIGLTAALTLGRSYLSTASTELHVFGLAAAGFGVATALIAPLAVPEVRARVWRVFTRRLRAVGLAGEEITLPSLAMVVQWAAVALPVVALIVLAFRPYVETVRGQTSPTLAREVAALQRMAGLPVDGQRQYYEQSFNWVLWYLGVPAVLLACAGAAVLGRRLVRAGDRPGLVAGGGATVGAAVPDHRLVGRHRALGPGRGAVAAVGLAPAGAGGPAGARAVRGLGLIAADRAGGGARRIAPDGHAGRDLLRARAGDSAAGDVAEPRDSGARVGRPLLVRGVQVRQPGAAARRRRGVDVRRVGRRRPPRCAFRSGRPPAWCS